MLAGAQGSHPTPQRTGRFFVIASFVVMLTSGFLLFDQDHN
jgi:hypothetical protein